jgi:hypothetical protein
MRIPQTKAAPATRSCQNDEVVDVLQEDPLVLLPVAEEAVQSPPAGSLDNIQQNTACKQLGGSTNAEAVAGDSDKAVCCGNGIDLRKEHALHEWLECPGN